MIFFSVAACAIHFDSTPVPAENVIGGVGGGFKVCSPSNSIILDCSTQYDYVRLTEQSIEMLNVISIYCSVVLSQKVEESTDINNIGIHFLLICYLFYMVICRIVWSKGTMQVKQNYLTVIVNLNN